MKNNTPTGRATPPSLSRWAVAVTAALLISCQTPQGPILTAKVMPSVPGYVNSPYTSPPKLIDVRDAAPGSTMICPYTKRPFLMPGPPAYVMTTVEVGPPPVQKESRGRWKPRPRIELDTGIPPVSVPAAATPKEEIPYGFAIPDRPGMAISPFAEQHQIVDVSGLSVGMPVRCPFTGKLFRVPPAK
jgi:hypothetical protein